VDRRGIVYVADAGHSVVHAIDVVSGTSRIHFGTRDAPGNPATSPPGIDQPSALAIDEDDNLYVADALHGSVLKLTPQGSSAPVATLVASSIPQQVKSIAVCPNGSIYIVEVTVLASNVYIVDPGSAARIVPTSLGATPVRLMAITCDAENHLFGYGNIGVVSLERDQFPAPANELRASLIAAIGNSTLPGPLPASLADPFRDGSPFRGSLNRGAGIVARDGRIYLTDGVSIFAIDI
jgi:hypothetical protein